MADPYEDVSRQEHAIVAAIVEATSNGYVGPNDRTSPLAARPAYDQLMRKGWLSQSATA